MMIQKKIKNCVVKVIQTKNKTAKNTFIFFDGFLLRHENYKALKKPLLFIFK